MRVFQRRDSDTNIFTYKVIKCVVFSQIAFKIYSGAKLCIPSGLHKFEMQEHCEIMCINQWPTSDNNGRPGETAGQTDK